MVTCCGSWAATDSRMGYTNRDDRKVIRTGSSPPTIRSVLVSRIATNAHPSRT
ncbi:Uncharacterised protein [Mycobacterium tuberculosis]|nr:Uncharacterised protein [Mycobacterium tuberculosis]CKS15078.1 Uncharacterised protein [Mycobacterium tuberculosis]CKS75190.1 Uncharacterised protein [Mycobacterium tuberculosis]CKT13476.1 Uncharacterised protein [Mycobacterium tuberculosis]COX47431.1 Uncharacterised protein [Mycobacterium tuberculosis]